MGEVKMLDPIPYFVIGAVCTYLLCKSHFEREYYRRDESFRKRIAAYQERLDQLDKRNFELQVRLDELSNEVDSE